MEREAAVAGTSLSRGLQADPSKWKGSMLWWQVPKQPWVTASFQEFSDGVWSEGGEVLLGTLCSLKVSESTPRFTDQGPRYKSERRRVSARPSPNLLLMSREYSLHTRFHLRLESSYPEILFLLQMWGRNKKEIRKKARWGDYSQKTQCPTWIFLLKASWFT